MIGSCIVDVLNELNENYNCNIKIVAGIRNKNNFLERFYSYKNLEIVELDVNNIINHNDRVDYIINAASNSNPKLFADKPVETLISNIIGTKNIMDFAYNKKTKRVIYISSGEVYGDNRDKELINFFTEDYVGKIDSTQVRSCYPIGKKSAETLMFAYTKEYKLESIVVRPCHTYGPTQTESDNRASSEFFRKSINNENIIMKSKGDQIRTYLYVIDCAIGILIALQNGISMQAYNVADNDSNLSIYEFAKKVSENSNSKIIFELPSENEKAGYSNIRRACLDGSKLKSIGWNPCFNIDEGIKNTIEIIK